jgi:hypothetical protein
VTWTKRKGSTVDQTKSERSTRLCRGCVSFDSSGLQPGLSAGDRQFELCLQLAKQKNKFVSTPTQIELEEGAWQTAQQEERLVGPALAGLPFLRPSSLLANPPIDQSITRPINQSINQSSAYRHGPIFSSFSCCPTSPPFFFFFYHVTNA